MEGLQASFDFSDRKRLSIILFILLALSVFPSGCQISLFNVPGDSIQSDDRITLKARGLQSGQYLSDDISMTYEYVRTGDSLRISGVVRFSSSIQSLFPTVSTFNLALVLADARGIVLDQQGLTTGYDRSVGEPLSFVTTMIIPAQTTLMAFRYSGAAAGKAKDGSSTPFWHDPVVR